MNNRPTIILKENKNRRIDSGHWWIFSNEIKTINTSIEEGTICNFSYSDGKPCGVGFFNPHSLISGRLLTKNSFKLSENFVQERILTANEYRQNLGLKNSYRLFFGESDFIGGLVIDRYNDIFVVEILSAGVERIIKLIIDTLYSIFNPKGIIIKRNHPYRIFENLKNTEDEILGKIPENIIIEENGAKFIIDFSKSQKTGWYFDQRENRYFLISYFKSRKVLDLYCYTGSFSILAAKNGAEMVWGIDSSQPAINIANENIKINALTHKNIIFKKEDAEVVLKALANKELPVKPDIILIDPPNLARNKKDIPQAVKLYIKILSQAIKGINTGFIAFSTCSHHISEEIFMNILKRATAISGKNVFFLENKTQSKDHPILLGMPETRYLNFVLLRVI